MTMLIASPLSSEGFSVRVSVQSFRGALHLGAHMWDMAKETKMAAAECDFYLCVLACIFYRF